MTCNRRRQSGFTLVEVLVVLAVVATIAGMAIPLVSAAIDAQRRETVEDELAILERALEEYYADNGAFPTDLRDATFYATYLQPGVNDTNLLDEWGNNVNYAYQRTSSPDTATVYSFGSNAVDDGVSNEEHSVVVYGAPPGMRTTRQRMRIIIETLADFLEGGGTLTGTWSTDRAALGLGSQYANDGFGTAFTLDASTFVLRSAGPDRVSGNSDDLTS